MRVIAGTFRHRLLLEADRSISRATTDKNRETIFNVLGQFFEGGVCLDLFAGTGAMGIEALSRGIERCVFVDRDPTAAVTIRANLKSLGLGDDRAIVRRADALSFLAAPSADHYRLIILDPPYSEGVLDAALAAIGSGNLLSRDGMVVAEAERQHRFPAVVNGLACVREIVAGNTRFALYKGEENP
jgi:16S rRNA (guanine(966)-N(2))-methyltransferase RsmD